jgi:hypothetical protein
MGWVGRGKPLGNAERFTFKGVTHMRFTLRGAASVAGLVLAVLAIAVSSAVAAPAAVLGGAVIGGKFATPLVAMSMLGLPAPLPILELQTRRQSPPGGYEVYEYFLYDTFTYAAAGSVAPGTFFTVQSADPTITNLNPPGTIPAGQWWHGRKLFITPRSEPSLNVASTAAGRGADWDKIQNTARSFLKFSLQSGTRIRPNIPLEALGGIGGSNVEFGGIGTAPSMVSQLRNHAHGGFPMDVILKDNETFNFAMSCGAATAISADLPLTLFWYGYLYVPAGRTG